MDENLGPPSRDQHYYFAHRLLPQLVDLDPEAFLQAFRDGKGQETLLDLWGRAADVVRAAEPIPPEGLSASLEPGPGGLSIVVVQLPPAERVPEAHFVAAAIRPAERRLLFSSRAAARFFTLEHSVEFEGNDVTVLGEWVRDKRGGWTHVNAGPGPAPDKTAFLAAVRERLS